MSGLANLWVFIWSWYNLPFTLSIMFCMFLSALQFTGLLGDAFDFDADADMEADFDFDADADADFDGDANIESGGGGLTALLDFLGIRKVPLTVLLLLLSATFGISGWVLSYLWVNYIGLEQTIFFVGIWIAASLIALVFGSRLAVTVARAVPSTSTTATSKEGLVGRLAEVISPQISQSYGQVRVRDAAGTTIILFAVTPKDAKPIPRDRQVVLVDFDPKKRIYTVMPLEDEL